MKNTIAILLCLLVLAACSSPTPTGRAAGQMHPGRLGNYSDRNLTGDRYFPGNYSRPVVNYTLAAEQLGIAESALREALGSARPDFASAAEKLNVTPEELRSALGFPERIPGPRSRPDQQ